MPETSSARERLQPLIGEWSLAMVPPGERRPDPLPDVGASTTWEWLGDSGVVVQRWSIPVEGAPDGLAVIAWDDARDTYLQHYFDDRDVVRVYELSLEDGVLMLERTQADFSPCHFAQRFTGTFADDGSRIDGMWEISHDGAWEKDFDLIYTRRAAT
jgi:hypothetical protein